MTANPRIYACDPYAWFLGVVKFYDTRKDFGYIALSRPEKS